MSKAAEKEASILLFSESAGIPKESELQKQLESKDDQVKIDALKKIILHILAGESLPKLMMSVIKFCIHTENHYLKKLLLLYWEVVDKKDSKGVLLHEMILVCNAMKNNLSHPNEYIRAATLRFLCKLKEYEILESLVPSITANLTHRHSMVRKNAVLTVMSVYQAFPELMRDAPELVEKFLIEESYPQAKKNAFFMLAQCDETRAVNYLSTRLEVIGAQSESFQLVALDLIKKVCKDNPPVKSTYIKAIYNLVNSPSHAVAFEGANTLVALSTAPTAIRAAVQAYCQLLQSESDINIKLIILGKLAQLRRRHSKILSEMVMDILRTLSSPSIEIRRKTLELASDLVSSRNVEQVVQLLKKELAKTEQAEQDHPEEYRKLLVDAMRGCAVQHAEVVGSIVQLLMNYLGVDSPSSSALDVIFFVRDILEEYPQLREQILIRLFESFHEIRAEQVYRVALWIIGEYCTELELIEKALSIIKFSVGPLPLLNPSNGEEEAEAKAEVKETRKPAKTLDGSYESQSSVTTKKEATGESKAGLRQKLLNGEWFLASLLAISLAKLALRYASLKPPGPEANASRASVLLLIVSVLRLGESHTSKPIDKDAHGRLLFVVKLLLAPPAAKSPLTDLLLQHNRQVLAELLSEKKQNETKHKAEIKSTEPVKQADDVIVVRQLLGRLADLDGGDDDIDVSKVLNAKNENTPALNRIYQLTGLSDPVYCEAKLTVLDYDIVLDILVSNQTTKTLQNFSIEFHTSGDLKVVDRPQVFTVAPKGEHRLQTRVKVTSTDSGVIFGNIVYDSGSGVDKTVVVLNNIHMDVMDYIRPSTTDDMKFRHMWQEFEWENKVAVNTDISDLNEYLNHISRITNMKCLTPQANLMSASNFLAANLYAKSLFGEDALLNLSVEKNIDSGRIQGYLRIRSKTQGIALSLGDKITSKQRTVEQRPML